MAPNRVHTRAVVCLWAAWRVRGKGACVPPCPATLVMPSLTGPWRTRDHASTCSNITAHAAFHHTDRCAYVVCVVARICIEPHPLWARQPHGACSVPPHWLLRMCGECGCVCMRSLRCTAATRSHVSTLCTGLASAYSALTRLAARTEHAPPPTATVRIPRTVLHLLTVNT